MLLSDLVSVHFTALENPVGLKSYQVVRPAAISNNEWDAAVDCGGVGTDMADLFNGRIRLFTLFKYTIYSLLTLNIFWFFLDDYAASAEVFTGGVPWSNLVEAYSATVDTLAWVILLLMFELETAVIPDEKLQGKLKWLLSGIRFGCYFFITYSFYGYWVKYGVVTDFQSLGIIDVCSLTGTEYTYIQNLDEYWPLTPEVCLAMQGEPIFQISGTQIIGTADQMTLARNMAITDVINAATWLIIVVVLEAEVWLQLKGLLSKRLLTINKYGKILLYSVLFLCALYWGIDGDFLDFWDAFLWLVAFVFIELNIFDWHEETEQVAVAVEA